MTDKEKIRVEIERLKESGCASPIVICDTLLAFIDSMQEEPLIEDLEEEWNRYITSEEYLKDIPGGLPVARHFASWQKKIDNRYANLGLVEQIRLQQKCYEKGMADMKQQIMKDAIEGYVDMLEFPDKTWIELSAIPKDLKDGDKVKLTIIKED